MALVLLSAVIYGAYAIGSHLRYQLTHHPHFAVTQVIVENASSGIAAELRSSLEGVLGVNVFNADLRGIRREVLSHTWISDASVRIVLPNRIAVRVQQRQPAGLVRLGSTIHVFGLEGEMICPLSEYAEVLDVPIVIGVRNDEQLQERLRAAMQTLDLIKTTSLLFWSQIETLDLSDPDNMVLKLSRVAAPIYLGAHLIPENIRNYLSIADQIRRDHPNLVYIELGYPDQVAVMPVGE